MTRSKKSTSTIPTTTPTTDPHAIGPHANGGSPTSNRGSNDSSADGSVPVGKREQKPAADIDEEQSATVSWTYVSRDDGPLVLWSYQAPLPDSDLG